MYDFYTPQYNPAQSQFDFGGMNQATEALKRIPAYKPQKYKSFDFKEPDYEDVYNKSYQAGLSPMRRQADERMRSLGQGLGNRGISGPAAQALKLQNSQSFGRDVAGLSSDLGGKIANSRMSHFMDTQRNQADENYRAAGFDNENSKFMSNLLMQYAQQMFNMNLQQNTLMNQINQGATGFYQNQQDRLERLGGIG